MDKHCFLDGGVPPNSRFNPTQMMPNWQSLTLEEPSCSPEKSHGFFRYPMDQHASYESALSSMVSSSPASNDNFAFRELIGKLGSNSAEIAQLPHSLMAGYMGGGSSSGGANSSSYTNSPPNPKLHFPIMDHFVKDNLANLGNSPPPPPPLSADPGFAERAAKFSCFGSRSFNGRTDQLGLNSTELPYRSNNPLMGNVKLPRVSSSPSLEPARSPMGARENHNSTQTHMEIRSTTVSETRFATSNDGSSVSGQTPNAGGMRISGDSNPRKRKGKSSVNSTKVQETGDDPNNKRAKSIEGNANENDSSGTEEKGGQKQGKAKSTKPSEPPKDYIHVRARRGQATDSHSLAERVRREKISERMKFLQDLVPGCNKVTGKALMLDEIINYVKSLQHRVEHLSMKLASVDPRDINIDNLLSKHAFDQADGSSCMPLQMSPMETDFFGHHEIPQLHTKGSVSQCSMDPMDCRSSGGIMQLPSVDDFGQSLAEFPGLCEGELQSIVQMGFGQNNTTPNQTSHMKIEL